jgi:tetratricopeptide (TPR) repeat protein
MLLYAGRRRRAEQILNEIVACQPAPSKRSLHVDMVVAKAKGSLAHYRGSFEAVRWFEDALDCARRAGDSRAISDHGSDLAFILTIHGAYEKAEAILRESLAEAERLGTATTIVLVKHNLGLTLLGLGKIDEAFAVESEAVRELHRAASPRLEGIGTAYLARILLRKGDFQGAEAAAADAVRLLEHAPASRAMAFALWAEALLAQGRANEAVVQATSGVELLRGGPLEEGEALVRLALAKALRAAKHAGADRAISEARDAIRSHADSIGDPLLQRSFLEQVPENVETLALANEWLDGSHPDDVARS